MSENPGEDRRKAPGPKLHIIDRWTEVRNELAGRYSDQEAFDGKGRQERFREYMNSQALGLIAALLVVAEVQ